MELVIAKQSMTSLSECANYVVPDTMWARFKFEGCYPDGTATIAKGGTIKAQLSMHNETVTLRESGQYQVCVLGRNTKSSVYVELLCDGGQNEKVVVAAGTNVTVEKTENDNVTTYTVSAKDDDSKTVIRGGEHITVSSTKDGDTTTYTISGEAGGSDTVVRAGKNVTVETSTEGTKTVYTVNGTEQGSHTVVKAGTAIKVDEGTEDGKTVYTVNGPVYKVASTTPNTLSVAESTSGNTVTFSLAATGGGGGGGDVELESTDPNLIITKE